MGNLATERFQTGNHCRVFLTGDGAKNILGRGIIDGPLGTNTGVDFNQDLGTRPVHVTGDAEPQDIVDGAHTYTVRLSELKLRDSEAAALINAGPVSIEVIDRFNNKLVSVAEGCKLTSGQLSVQANNLLQRNLSFMALRIKG